MVADSNPARRPALSFFALLAVPLAALLSLGAAALPAAQSQTTPAQAHAAADDDSAVTINLAPVGNSIVSGGQDLTVTAEITNGTSAALPAGTIDLYLAERALTTRTALGEWLRPAENSSPGDRIFSAPTGTAIQPDSSLTLTLTVPAASIGLGPSNAWGARGIAATLSAGETEADPVQGRGVFVWSTGEPVTPVNLAIVVPITTPPGATGLIAADDLEKYTGPGGLLTRQLDDVVNQPVAIAIDPMILASIRVLGSSVPPTALDWLERLDFATNDIFPLSYADADIALQAHAGVNPLLVPTSFAPALNPDLFTVPETPDPEESTSEPTNESTKTPTPTPTAGEPVMPTTEELLDWDYTRTDIGWPSAGSVAPADLDVFAASGLTTTILSGTNVTQPDAQVTPNSVFSVASGRAAVGDLAIGAAIQRAVTAATEVEWNTAMSEVLAQLAVVSAENPATPRTLLATFDRGEAQSSPRLGETLAALSSVPWQAGATLDQALAAEPAQGVTVTPQAEPEGRVEAATRLLSREAEIAAFSSVAADPVILTATSRLDVLGLFATSWRADDDAWQEAVRTNLTESGAILNSVTVTSRGPLNVAANRVELPIALNNAYNQAVTVKMQVVPSNGRLVVDGDIEATIDAASARTVTVPVTAAVGNGDVTLRVNLFTPDGVQIGQTAFVTVDVHADWEGIVAISLAILVVLFFGFGVWRNIARRRKDRAEQAEQSETAPESAETPEKTETPETTDAAPSATHPPEEPRG
ncbi:DUF6049 family protein [Glaciibacter superstes]|uniref:DUF6049 family protein n=1 Tax=Glaciibacter superstes TaxID=501023 RepID=UPI0003B75F01|nr:DUF6049 family protein [Glaciibacter superstes]